MAVGYGIRRRLAPVRRPARQVLNRGWRLYDLAPRTVDTHIAPWQAASSGTANYPVGAGTDEELFMLSDNGRMRMTGTVTKVKVYTSVVPTTLQIRFWRDDGTDWTATATTENLAASCAIATLNTITLATPISVVRGDYYSVICNHSAAFLFGLKTTTSPAYITASGPNSSRMKRRTGAFVANTTDIDWTVNGGAGSNTGSNVNNEQIPVEMIVATGPSVVFEGDSWIAGRPNNRAFVAPGFSRTQQVESESLPYKFGALSGLTWQNMGYADDNLVTDAQNANQFMGRYQRDYVNARAVVLCVGGNDAFEFVVGDTFRTNFTTIVSTLKGNKIPVVIVMLGPYTGATDTQMSRVAWFNGYIRNIASQYRCPVIETEDLLGKPRSIATTSGAVSSSTDATPIVVTTGSAHGFGAGNTFYVRISGHATNTAANGVWLATQTGASTFSLKNPDTEANLAGSGAGAGSGGTWELLNYGGNKWNMMAGTEYTGAPDYDADTAHTTPAGYQVLANHVYRVLANR